MAPKARIPVQRAVALARDAAERLRRDPRIRLVYLFGSAADESATHVRDIDIAIRSVPAIAFEDRLRIHGGLAESAGRDFDLVSLDEASVVLAREVADGGICLFSRSPDDEVEFVTRARSRYWDFKPYLDEQWRLAGARQEARRRGLEA